MGPSWSSAEGNPAAASTFTTAEALLAHYRESAVSRTAARLVERITASTRSSSRDGVPSRFVPRTSATRPGQDTFQGIRPHYAVESVPLGTAEAIGCASDNIHERFVVCNGDVLTDPGYQCDGRGSTTRGGPRSTIALAQVEDPSAFGVVPTAAAEVVIAFVEKPARERRDAINAGTYVLEPSFLYRIPPRLNVSGVEA